MDDNEREFVERRVRRMDDDGREAFERVVRGIYGEHYVSRARKARMAAAAFLTGHWHDAIRIMLMSRMELSAQLEVGHEFMRSLADRIRPPE